MTFILSGAGGALLAWAAHALLPDPGVPAPGVPTTSALADGATRRAIADASILLATIVLRLINSDLASAVGIAVTVVFILDRADVIASQSAALGLTMVNVVGGVAASVM